MFHALRQTGNRATRDGLGTQSDAFHHLKIAHQLAIWFYRTVKHSRGFKAPALVPPPNLMGETEELRREIAALDAEAEAREAERDEAATRELIDEQLREVGWVAHTTTLRYGDGARPEKGKNLVIAEWPTTSGPADYVLFVGLEAVGVVEAKRRNAGLHGAGRSRPEEADDLESLLAELREGIWEASGS